MRDSPLDDDSAVSKIKRTRVSFLRDRVAQPEKESHFAKSCPSPYCSLCMAIAVMSKAVEVTRKKLRDTKQHQACVSIANMLNIAVPTQSDQVRSVYHSRLGLVCGRGHPGERPHHRVHWRTSTKACRRSARAALHQKGHRLELSFPSGQRSGMSIQLTYCPADVICL